MENQIEEKLQAKADKVRSEYKVSLQPETAIELFVDGLCENPGAMHIGLHARQGQNSLFAEHLAVGNGTCNEAEYIAVKSGLILLQLLFPNPGVPIRVHSDSQLVTKQVAGEWRSSGQMQVYCTFLRKLQRVYPFELKKIPRTENQVADSLAQKYVSKNSGRCLSLEQGRFNVAKQAASTVKNSNAFNALTNENLREYFEQYNMHGDLQELSVLNRDGKKTEAIQLAGQIREKATDILENAPAGNAMVAQWVQNTVAIVQKCVDEIVQAIESGKELDLQYLVEEMAGMEAGGGEVFGAQVEQMRSSWDTPPEAAAEDECGEAELIH